MTVDDGDGDLELSPHPEEPWKQNGCHGLIITLHRFDRLYRALLMVSLFWNGIKRSDTYIFAAAVAATVEPSSTAAVDDLVMAFGGW